MACNCIGGNPCPCQRGAWPMGQIAFGPVYHWPSGAAQMAPNGELLDLLAKANLRVMTPKEIYEQKVSFIYGQLMDCAPGITVEEVRKHLAEMGVVDPEPIASSDIGSTSE